MVEGHVIGDVDKRVDRTKADRLEACLHPCRARAVLDAAHKAQAEAWAKLFIIEIDGQADRGLTFQLQSRSRGNLERAETGGCQIAGDAKDRRAVRAVRRQVDLDDRIVETGIGSE
ncbi:hypothetical protein D3C73_883480 [compost metagenome]